MIKILIIIKITLKEQFKIIKVKKIQNQSKKNLNKTLLRSLQLKNKKIKIMLMIMRVLKLKNNSL
jgi:DNA polymerase III psi subunit